MNYYLKEGVEQMADRYKKVPSKINKIILNEPDVHPCGDGFKQYSIEADCFDKDIKHCSSCLFNLEKRGKYCG